MSNIYLCGFMAAGKTTSGEILSDKLNYSFIDLDKRIIENENKLIIDIFNEYGEEYFRKLENKYLKDIVKLDNYVIALGGGTVLDKENVNMIKENNGIIIFLDTDIDIILKRIENDNKRPLIKSQNKEEKIKLYNSRYKTYKEISDFTTGNQNIDDILNFIRSKK